MTDEPQVKQLENRIDTLESKIEKMMPSRRDALKMGGAALVGGSLMAGTASAGTNQVGTIGDKDATPPQLVDLHSEDINNADTLTTQDLVVNGTATGVTQDLQGCRVHLTSDQSVLQGDRDKIVFDAKSYDQGANFDTNTGNFTCPEDGLYIANLGVRAIGGGNGDSRRILIGSGASAFLTGKGAYEKMRLDDVDQFSTTTVNKYSQNDTIAAYFRNVNSDDAILSGPSNNDSFFEVAFLGSF